MKRLNILHIQFSSKSAGSCAYRLHVGFLEKDTHHSNILSLMKDDPELPSVTYLPDSARMFSKVNNKLDSLLNRYDQSKFGLFSKPIIGYPFVSHKLVQNADVIYVHWVMMGFFTINSFKNLIATGKKIIVFMHDMWYMTGGCHYAINCDLYLSKCVQCPIFPDNNTRALNQSLKKNTIYQKFDNILFVSPSKWLKDLGTKSSLLSSKKIRFIPNYFKSDTYKPQDTSVSRKILNLPLNKKIVCFGAVNINSAYKGWGYLKDAFKYLEDNFSSDELEILVFGEVNTVLMTEAVNFKINFLGYLNDEKDIAIAYTASDVFVLPSTMDNQPTTVVESLNCGIPVVVFELGGTYEMIDHKRNGYVAAPYDSCDLAKGIHYCLSNPMNVYLKEEYLSSRVMGYHEELLKTFCNEED